MTNITTGSYVITKDEQQENGSSENTIEIKLKSDPVDEEKRE